VCVQSGQVPVRKTISTPSARKRFATSGPVSWRRRSYGGRCAPIEILAAETADFATCNKFARAVYREDDVDIPLEGRPIEANAGVTLDNVRGRRIRWDGAIRLIAAGERRVVAEVKASGRHEGQSRLAQWSA
jgi:hypothetical protein